jgi:osmoprotectant transport system permease protein
LNVDNDFDPSGSLAKKLIQRTNEHLIMVLIAMLFSVLLGIPMGIYASKDRRFGHLVVLISAVIQTVPSLALLCLLIPFLGIGLIPALVVLFLYGLLPVVINTYTGLMHIEPRHIEMAQALGLTPSQRLRFVELPLASASIWAGVKTSTITSIGTATLAALIGAGGYGALILTGLALNDMHTILLGALPAAAMALIASLVLDVVGHYLVKRV